MMKKTVIIIGGFALILALVFVGYHFFRPVPERLFLDPLVLVEADEVPSLTDDMQGALLHEAIDRHLKIFSSRRMEEDVPWGSQTVPLSRIVLTLKCFRDLLEQKGIIALADEIPKRFLIYRASGQTRRGDVLFTGYFQPVLEARTQSDELYRYPLYKTPSDMQVLNLGAINPAYQDERIALRVDEGKAKPYFDREAIDSGWALAGKGLELCYLRDYLDRYFLHIQGSGILMLEDGRMVQVGYAGTNHFPYVSLGKELIREGVISAEKMSLQAIREYFGNNPEEAARLMNRNRRYIFFDEYSGGLKGSEGVELIPGRSIATDKKLFPGGGLAYMISQKPAWNGNRNREERLSLTRFVVDQDSGSAIKGPGRVDLFWGNGDEAGERAGQFMQTGELYYLLVKEEG